jgi:hypothetical protein
MWPSAAHNPINPAGKDENISQQPIEDESTRQWPRAAGERNHSAGECGEPRQHRDDRHHSIFANTGKLPHIATRHSPAQARGALGL